MNLKITVNLTFGNEITEILYRKFKQRAITVIYDRSFYFLFFIYLNFRETLDCLED